MVNAPFSAYSIAYMASAVIPLVAIVLAWGRRLAPGAHWLLLMLLSIAEWTFTTAVGWTNLDIQLRIFCQQLSAIGAATVPVFLLFFALEYTRRVNRVSPSQMAQLLVLPVAAALAGLTNDSHHLIWTSILPDAASPGALIYTHGPLYWLAAVYSLVITMVAVGMIVSFALRAGRLYRLQSSAVVLAILLPWASQVLVFALPGRLTWFDPGMTLGVSALIISVGVLRYGLLDLVPVARDSLIDQMPEGLMVLDTDGRIVDVNPAARALLRVTERETAGKRATEAFPLWPEFAERIAEIPASDVIETPWGRVLGLQMWALGKAPAHEGTAVLVRDVTTQIRAEQLLGDARTQLDSWVGEIEEIETGLNRAHGGAKAPSAH